MENRSTEVLTIAVFFLPLTWLATGLRCYVRAVMLRNFGTDDWLMLMTQMFFTTYIICQIGGVIHGTGRHLWDLTPQQNETALHFWFLCEIFYIISCTLLKMSIGMFLLRIANNKVHIWILRLLTVGSAVFGTVYLFMAVFQCSPVSAWWMLGPSSHSCIDAKIITGATYCASVINSIADMTFGILPIFIICGLEMKKKQKLMVGGLLAFAAIASVATIIRLPWVPTLELTKDFLWDTVGIAVWSTIEVGIGITAGCIATLRPLLVAVFKRGALISTALSSSRMTHSRLEPEAPKKGFQNSELSSELSRSRSQRARSPLPFCKKAPMPTTELPRSDRLGNTTVVSVGADAADFEEIWISGPANTAGISKTKDIEVTFEEIGPRHDSTVDLEKALPGIPRSTTSSDCNESWLSDRSSDHAPMD